MLLKCVAIDDDPAALQLLSAYIEKVPSLKLEHVFEKAIDGVEYLKKHPVQLLFINSQVPDIHVSDLASSSPERPMIIFTTAQKKISMEGFELDAVDILIKPFSFEQFQKAVFKSEEFFKYKSSLKTADEFLYVYSDYRLLKISLGDIQFIESLEDYIRIHLTEGRPVLTLTPLKKIIQKIPAEKFQRVHRSYVVALDKIKSFSNKKVVLDNAEVPVSESYVEVIRKLRKV